MTNKASASWQPLSQGDEIYVIAPGYGATEKTIRLTKDYLDAKQYRPIIPHDLIGNDPLCSNRYAVRLKHLRDALSSDAKAIWCIKGGYGTTQLMPELLHMPEPSSSKLFIGFSDNTALHNHLTQQWNWQTLHAPVLWQIVNDKVDELSKNTLWDVIEGRKTDHIFPLTALNSVPFDTLHASITGGNMMLNQCSLATHWQTNTRDKILFLEEIDETPYRVDRMLVHLSQTPLLREAKALIFGDFTGEAVEAQRELTYDCLKRCADYCQAQFNLPVFKLSGVGHEATHLPLPLNSRATISNTNSPQLKVQYRD